MVATIGGRVRANGLGSKRRWTACDLGRPLVRFRPRQRRGRAAGARWGGLQSSSLSQILPADFEAGLVQSSFNIHWRGAISYDPAVRGFSIQVAVPDGAFFGSKMRFVDLLLDPEARMFTPRDPAAWAAARNIGRARIQAICDEREWRLARAAVPLSAPTVSDRRIWLNFAVDLEKRLPFPTSGTVWNQRLFLPVQSDADYVDDLKEFRRVLTMVRAKNISGNFYIVSPDLPHAHAVIKHILDDEKADLARHRFVIVGDEAAASQVASTLANHGGKTVTIVTLRQVLPPAAQQKDYDWAGQRACAALSKATDRRQSPRSQRPSTAQSPPKS